MKKINILSFVILFLPSTLLSQNLDSTNVVSTFVSSKNDSIPTYYNQLLNFKTPMSLIFNLNNQFNFTIYKSSQLNFNKEINKNFLSQSIIKNEKFHTCKCI